MVATGQNDRLWERRVFRDAKCRASSEGIHFGDSAGLDVAGHGNRAILCVRHVGTGAESASRDRRRQDDTVGTDQKCTEPVANLWQRPLR